MRSRYRCFYIGPEGGKNACFRSYSIMEILPTKFGEATSGITGRWDKFRGNISYLNTWSYHSPQYLPEFGIPDFLAFRVHSPSFKESYYSDVSEVSEQVEYVMSNPMIMTGLRSRTLYAQ